MITRFAFVIFIFSSAAYADLLTCADGMITVEKTEPLAEQMCEAAEDAASDLAACNLPLNTPVRLAISRDLEDISCVGVYHCGTGLIEVLPPENLETARHDSSLFYGMDAQTHFKSVIFHELVHAAYDSVPCPFDDICRATTEYLAYSLQIRALDDATRASMGLAEFSKKRIEDDEINTMILFLAPDTFATKSFKHLMQRPDPCAFVGEIAAGRVFFDYDEP